MNKAIAGILVAAMTLTVMPKKVEASWGKFFEWTVAAIVVAGTGCLMRNAYQDAASDNPKGIAPLLMIGAVCGAAVAGVLVANACDPKYEVLTRKPNDSEAVQTTMFK